MKIIATIKALFAKAESTTNEHEAVLFMEKAYALLEKHELTSADLDIDDPVGNHYNTENNKGSGDWPEFLYSASARYYGCRVVAIRTVNSARVELAVFGRESAIVTLNEMHAYLVKTVRAMGRLHAVEWQLTSDKAARRIGNALTIRISSLTRNNKPVINEKTPGAIAVVDQIQALIEAAYPKLRESSGGKIGTSSEAKKVAEGISLSSQVGRSNQLKLG